MRTYTFCNFHQHRVRFHSLVQHAEAMINLRNLVITAKQPQFDSTTCEIATIALLAYAEAFFRGHFASMLNICPELVRNLKRATNRDVSIDPAELLDLES